MNQCIDDKVFTLEILECMIFTILHQLRCWTIHMVGHIRVSMMRILAGWRSRRMTIPSLMWKVDKTEMTSNMGRNTTSRIVLQWWSLAYTQCSEMMNDGKVLLRQITFLFWNIRWWGDLSNAACWVRRISIFSQKNF